MSHQISRAEMSFLCDGLWRILFRRERERHVIMVYDNVELFCPGPSSLEYSSL